MKNKGKGELKAPKDDREISPKISPFLMANFGIKTFATSKKK